MLYIYVYSINVLITFSVYKFFFVQQIYSLVLKIFRTSLSFKKLYSKEHVNLNTFKFYCIQNINLKKLKQSSKNII
jgi:hypothetical protein